MPDEPLNASAREASRSVLDWTDLPPLEDLRSPDPERQNEAWSRAYPVFWRNGTIIARARLEGTSFQEEAVEKALAELIANIHRYVDDNLQGLFSRMVQFRVIDVYRKQVKRREELPDWKEVGHVPETRNREIARALHDCVSRLNEAQRKVMQGLLACLSDREVSDQTGLPVNTVYSYKHRAIPSLRRCLERKGFTSVL